MLLDGGGHEHAWVVVGKSAKACEAKFKELVAKQIEIMTELDQQRDAREEEESARYHAGKCELEATAEKVAKSHGEGEPWDVTGTYHIFCWDVQEEECTDDVYLNFYRKVYLTHVEIFASVDLSIFDGGFRLVDKQSVMDKGRTVVTTKAVGTKHNLTNDCGTDEQEETEEEESEEEDNVEDEDPTVFHLPVNAQPSADHHTWRFYWKGYNNKADAFQYVKHESAELTFSGPGKMRTVIFISKGKN